MSYSHKEYIFLNYNKQKPFFLTYTQETSTCLPVGCPAGYSAVCAPYTVKEREKR